MGVFGGDDWHTPKFLKRFKCECQNENNKKKVKICFFIHSILGVKGCARAIRWGLKQVASGSIICMDLHKPNNKLVNA
jgi:hypothetical protein